MPATEKKVSGKAAMVAVLKRAKKPMPAKEIIAKALANNKILAASELIHSSLRARAC